MSVVKTVTNEANQGETAMQTAMTVKAVAGALRRRLAETPRPVRTKNRSSRVPSLPHPHPTPPLSATR